VSVTAPGVRAQAIVGLNVLWTRLAPGIGQRRSDRDGEAQEAPHIPGAPEQSVKRLALIVSRAPAWSTASRTRASAAPPQARRARPSSLFASQAIEVVPVSVLRGGQHGRTAARLQSAWLSHRQKTRFDVLHKTGRTLTPTSADQEMDSSARSAVRRWPPMAERHRVAKEGFKQAFYHRQVA